jgi:outer membrane lipoprotein-sorting protein
MLSRETDGEATILGRPAYTLDLGPDLCARNLAEPAWYGDVSPRGSVVQGGRTLVWVDKQTFFALKRESFGADGRLESRDEVTDLAYDAAIPDRTFTFSSQQGDSVEDLRPQPYNPPIPPHSTIGACTEKGSDE